MATLWYVSAPPMVPPKITMSSERISGDRRGGELKTVNSSFVLVPLRRSESRMVRTRSFAVRRNQSIRRSLVVSMAPEEEKMTRRSPLDFPIEWERPKPGRRPDIFPQFSPMKTPLPPPLPADPPEEDEEEEEEKKEEEEEDPEKEEPETPEKQ